MSFIGTLEQLNLANVLQRLEAYAKTGLLVIKQEVQWVELYFRDGRLLCIGPIRGTSNLGERLLQAGVISPQALQDATLATGESQNDETRMALALMDLGYVSRDELRAWTAKEAAGVIQVLLTWSSGQIYFEDGRQTPPERLLVALSISSLLPSMSLVTSTSQTVANTEAAVTPVTSIQEPTKTTISVSDIMQAPTLVEAAPFFTQSTPITVSFTSSAFPSLKNISSDLPSLTSPTRVTTPIPPKCIDTSFMKLEMILMPADLSALREQNPEMQITPEQWRLLTRVDGRTSLQMASQALALSPEVIRQLAGELIAMGVVQATMPVEVPVNELSPISHSLITSGLSNGHVGPGYAAATAQPWVAITPTTDPLRPLLAPAPVETQSQWGNGGNGATFVPGRGWVLASQPVQVLQPGGPTPMTNRVFAQAGGVR